MRGLLRISLLTLIIVVMSSTVAIGQIKVSENGKVGIKYENTPLSNLVLNHEGLSNYESYFYAPSKSSGGCAFLRSEYGSSGSSIVHALYSYMQSGNGYSIGIKSYSWNASPSSSGRAYGIQGFAGNATSGYNYAIYGRLLGSNNGAGVFGTVSGDGYIGGQYAGYFRGDVKVENALWAYSITESDIKFKKNVKDIPDDEYLSKFNKIRPVEYNLAQREIKVSSDTTSTVNYFKEDSQIFNKKKFGLIAQELQEIYPNLVYEGQEGELGIDYIGMIPVLIKVLQIQQHKIDRLEELLNSYNLVINKDEDD